MPSEFELAAATKAIHQFAKGMGTYSAKEIARTALEAAEKVRAAWLPSLSLDDIEKGAKTRGFGLYPLTPDPSLEGCQSLVLYAPASDLDEIIAAFKLAKPNVVSRKL